MRHHPMICLLLAATFILPIMLAFVTVNAASSTAKTDTHAGEEQGWWVETNVDRNHDGIGDMVEIALATPGWVGDDGRIGIIVDFDHTPTDEDAQMLFDEVDFVERWRLPLIDAISGTVLTTEILTTSRLPGVVMVELNGMLGIAMDSVVGVHGVDQVWEETGYTGSGTTVAIIDTGIDGDHEGLNDLDDDNSTNDTKVIAFYDAINAPEQTNGTEIFPYDDQGHGSHCAGITAGTGAPDFDFVGIAPQARLVGVKVLDSGGSGSFDTVMGGMQWTVDHRYEFNIRAASMSLGGFGLIEWNSAEEDSVNRMANEMMRSGIALFIAAGNSAIAAQVGTPGSAEDVITVGALDKDTSIAIYSSQGPTEEGRIKPNIAFVGTDVMSVDFNTKTGYTSKSGTSMATPGAAGLGALMLQANPDLSPFDLRNIMQETSTYRVCHYMASNEPCPEDLIPKNRQNNVYGHGHVNSLPSVLEAASQSYQLNTNYSLNLTSALKDDNLVHLSSGDAITLSISEPMDTIQWRSNHLRDDWAIIHGYDHETTTVTLSHSDIIDQLEHLPGINLEGNQTLSIRGIKDDQASPNLVVYIMIMGTEKEVEPLEVEGLSGLAMLSIGLVSGLALALAGLGAMAVITRDGGNLFHIDEEKTFDAVLITDSDM